MLKKLAVTQIRPGKGGFICTVKFVGSDFIVFENHGTEAIVIVRAEVGRKIVPGKSFPEFSESVLASTPKVGDKVIAFVEEEEGLYCVIAWGHEQELEEIDGALRMGAPAAQGKGVVLKSVKPPEHTIHRAPRRTPPVRRAADEPLAPSVGEAIAGAEAMKAQVS